MYFWTGVSTIAGALRRCVWIDQAEFTWYPNFYIVFVARPAVVSKSTTVNVGMKLLKKVPGIHFGPDVVTWQSLVRSLAASTETIQYNGKESALMSAMTIEASEFGTFLNPEDRQMVDVLVSLWDGRASFEKQTKTQGDDMITNPWINIIACTTPAWLEGAFPEYMIGGGFTSRCVFVFADEKRQLVPYLSEVIPKDHYDTRKKLIEDLIKISRLRGAFTLMPDAIEWGSEWYIKHNTTKPPNLSDERFGAYLVRKQTHMHKLAMVLSVSQRSDLTLTALDLQVANELITALETDMPRVFERIGTSREARGQAELVQIVKAAKKIKRTDLYHTMFRTLSYNDFEAALRSATEAGYVTQREVGGTLFIYIVEEE